MWMIGASPPRLGAGAGTLPAASRSPKASASASGSPVVTMSHAGALETSGGGEGGEQRHMDGAEAPDTDQSDEIVGALSHESGDPVPGSNAKSMKRRTEARRSVPQLAIGQDLRRQIRRDDVVGHRASIVTVAQGVGDADLAPLERGEQFADTARGGVSRRV